jgi:CRP-like cAMP-binding protein
MSLDEIRKLPHFAVLSEREFNWLLERAKVVSLDRGDVVLSRDIRPNHYTFLIEGRWTMRRWARGVDTPVVWTDDRPGSWHGGIDVIDVLAPADVVVDSHARILVVPRQAVHELMARAPGFAIHMMQGLTEGVNRIHDHVVASGTAQRMTG